MLQRAMPPSRAAELSRAVRVPRGIGGAWWTNLPRNGESSTVLESAFIGAQAASMNVIWFCVFRGPQR